MTTNFFKTIRNSNFTISIISCLLSNIVVFGQPIEQMTNRVNQLEAFRLSNYAYANSYKHHNISESDKTISKTDKKTINESEPNIFHAIEEQGVIGTFTSTEKENPRDNFFTVILPENLDINSYDILLKYSLYGIEQADQTTKSINNSPSFGGQTIKINAKWNDVSEYLPKQHIRSGKNEIFFNRWTDVNYQYKVKDVYIELIKKTTDQILLSQNKLINFNGKVHLLGYTNEYIRAIQVNNKTIQIKDGIFEYVLENVSKKKKKIILSFETSQGNFIDQEFEVEYKTETISYQFDTVYFEEYNSSSKKVTLKVVRLDSLNNTTNNTPLVNSFKISGIHFKEFIPLNSDIENVTAGHFFGYRTNTSNLKDSTFLKLHLEYDPTKIPDGYSDKDVRTFSFDKKKREWITLPVDSLDYKNKVVISTYNGDTDYVNGVIKVPEMAETASFTPTTITDMKYANPASRVVSIAPPRPNYTGAAATCYPIKFQTGRNGMMPSLSVNYSNEGGNGWMGVGWDMQMPAITLDTRWGVPRFNPTNESEIYQLNGETMVMKVGENEYTNPHRSEEDITRSSTKTFFLRKEGGYQKIVRYGNSPQNYRWVVWDKYGNKSLYGGHSGAVVENAIVRDEQNNITHWALHRTYDTFGNYVNYDYKEGISNINGVDTKYLYPNWIQYTHNTNSPVSSFYEVKFIRNNGGTEIIREDVTLNARTGTLMSNSDLLTKILVRYKDGSHWNTVRSYEFEYEESAFKKTQLSKISEFDAAGNLFYSNSMEYYDDIGSANVVNGNQVNWTANANPISSPLHDIASGDIANAIPNGSALGSSISDGYSLGLRVGVGLGFNAASVSVSLGGSYNYSQNKEKTRISFLDINGDGLPDKVFKPNAGGLKYMPNLGINTEGEGVFGSELSVGWVNLDETKSRTNGFGFDANAVVIGIGASRSKTRMETDGYFTDFNGDGLPDIVIGGTVKFNTTNSWESNNPINTSFSPDVTYTPNTIYSGDINPALIDNLELETLEELRSEHPQYDHIKAWKAPYTGIIKITGDAKLLNSNVCGTSNQNNFRFRIERASEGQTSDAQPVPNSTKNFTTQGTSQTYNLNNIQVNKGDILFFRVHNNTYGCGGEIEWNPNIHYNSATNINSTTDEHGNNYRDFNAENDYIVNNGGSWRPDITETSITINPNIDNNTFAPNGLSDEVSFIIERTRYTHSSDPEHEGEILTDETITHSRTYIYNPTSGTVSPESGSSTLNYLRNFGSQYPNSNYSYSFRFYVKSDSNVQWNTINWQPTITSVSGVVFPDVNYEVYDDNVNQKSYYINSVSLPAPNIDPNIPNDGNNPLLRISHNMFQEDYAQFISQSEFEDSEFPIKINWVVKEKIGSTTKTLHKSTFYLHRIHNSCLPFPPYSCAYQFRTSPLLSQGMVVDPSNPSHATYYQYDQLTKDKVQDIKNASGRIYTAFYLDNPKFGKNNGADITTAIHPDEQVNYPTFSPITLTSPFIAKNIPFFGWTYRGWGQFLYNGGIKYNYNEDGNITNPNNPDVYDGYIDMSVFDYETDPGDIQSQIDNADPEQMDLNAVSVRYTFYNQNNEQSSFLNSSILNNINTPISYGNNGTGNITATLGRFGEHNLYNLYIDPATLTQSSTFIGLKQRAESKGSALSGNIGTGSAGFSGTSSHAKSKVLNQYLDLNGDRYPDIVTDGTIQFTDMQGGLSNVIGNNFVSGSSSHDNTEGVNISGMFPNSTASDNNKNTQTNINSGINQGDGETYDVKQWNDINGDGLLDRITITTHDVKVQLNTGYGFSDEIVWGNNYSDLYASTRESDGIGASFGNASYAFGLGGGESTAKLNAALIDVNGDGLPDLVNKSGNNYKYYLNNGSRFDTDPNRTFYNGVIDQDYSITGNIFGSYTYGFVIQLVWLTIKIPFTVSAGANAGFNEKQISVQDIDGDGLPDVLEKGNDNGEISARLNKVGKTNFLKAVNTPLGGRWVIDYKREGNTYNMPQNKWVLNSILTNDGFTADNNYASDKTLTTVSYENPKHDRREREFLGFEQVKVNQQDPSSQETYRYTLTEYHNSNIYLKGLVKSTSLYDASDNLLNESTTTYNIMDPDNPQVNLNSSEATNYLQSGLTEDHLDKSRLFVAPVKTISTTYENGEGLSLEQQFTDYDKHGNLLKYKNPGDTYSSTLGNDAYRTEMTYYPNISTIPNSTGFVKNMKVIRQSDGQLLRKRNAEYTNQGKINKITANLNNSESNEIVLDYDVYGNLIKSTLMNGFSTNIIYDTKVHAYPIEVSNSFNEVSTSEYNYLFGVPILATDINGQQMRTRIDNRGRLVEITAPNEMQTNVPVAEQWTIRMQYKGESTLPPTFNGNNYVLPAVGSFQAINPGSTQPTTSKHHAVTRHHVENAQGNQLLTVSLVDGFGQAIQLKKTLLINDNGSNQLKWLISGKETKDAFGRVIEARLPTTQTGYPTNPNNLPASAFNYLTGQNTIPPTLMAYDVRDRVISSTQPGEGSSTTSDFSISDGLFLTTTTNELNQTFETYTDVRGRQRKTIQNGELTTQFYYNAIGEKIKVKNQQGYDTFYKYDLAGRRIEERHPDRGLTWFVYDTSGNLIKRLTSNLLANGQQQAITYSYDYNRLKTIAYTQNPENSVKYSYGEPYNSEAIALNAVGRLITQKDASGVQGFGYDNLGNLNSHLRGVAVAGRHTFWFYTQWQYDSHSRVKQITYPDEEVVNYNYNIGGTLNSITRTIHNVVTDDPIVNSIKYNDLGERTEITYGNGTSTNYTYDNRRRLQDLSHQFSGFEITNRYGYDTLSNITEVNTQNPTNSIPSSGQLGGPVSHSYEYDDYNRLISAKGYYTGPNDLTTPLLAQNYSLQMTYDLAHNITSKTQTHIQGEVDNHGSPITNPETMVKTNYQLNYGKYAEGVYVAQGENDEFGYVQPHAPREIVETPDDSGIQETNPNYKKKTIEYDANGNQLAIKQLIFEGDQAPAYQGIVEPETITLRKNLRDEEDRLRAVNLNPDDTNAHPVAVYTYDAGGQRVVRYIPGRLDARSNATMASKNERDEVVIYPSPMVTAKALSKPGRVPRAGSLVSSYTKHYYIGSERVSSTLGTVRDLGLFLEPLIGMFPNIRTMANATVNEANTGMTNTYTAMEQGINLNAPVIEGTIKEFKHKPDTYDVYWYHSDHLGSSSYISNMNGTVSQHMEYLPFGELLVDEHLNSYNTPFKFNSKELDEETGNYYYGARYYDPKTSIWLSVDPLAEQMPSWSSYNYTFSNPVRFTDPTGMAPEVFDNPIYDTNGNHIGNTKEGFTGQILIYSGNEDVDFSSMSATEAQNLEGVSTYDNQRGNLSDKAQNKILTNVLNCFELPDGTILDSNENFDIITTGKDRSGSNASHHGKKDGKYQIRDDGFYYEYTVENTRATLGNHEAYGHGVLDLGGGRTEDHLKIFLMSDKFAPKNVTNKWKENNLYNIIKTYNPARGEAAPRNYYMEYLKLGGEKFW